MKKISVIIPCYNCSRWLPKCFLSLANQTIGIENLELIFVDDASTDNGATWNMLLDFEKAFPDSVMVIQLTENMRQGGARNVALEYATGDYISFVDADDWVDERLYEITYENAVANNADIIQFNHDFYVDGKGIIKNRNRMENKITELTTYESRKNFLIYGKYTCGCWNKLYKRGLIADSGVKFAEHVVYEEPLFVFPLFLECRNFVTLDEHLYIYRQNTDGTMRSTMQNSSTLYQHSQVQLSVWNHLKSTPHFKNYYEEIKFYFLFTYLYEFLAFAKKRNLSVSFKDFSPLAAIALAEVPDLDTSPYASHIPEQMKLYRLIKKKLTENSFFEYYEQL